MPYSISVIEGIEPLQKEKFNSAGIISVEQLLARVANPEGRSALQEQTGIDEISLMRLINHADRSRIN